MPFTEGAGAGFCSWAKAKALLCVDNRIVTIPDN